MNIFIASIQNNEALLTSEESWHCAKVLRKKSGEHIHIIDGKGNFYEGTLELVSEKLCKAKLTKGPTPQNPRSYYLHLAIAPTKQLDRIEWMIEKVVEIGVDELSFINSKNSERTVLKAERIVKIVESAVKQSLQARIPKVNELCGFKEFMKVDFEGQKFIAHCFEEPKLEIKDLKFSNTSNLVMIGPEGDFTREEVEMASEKGFNALGLGNTRLRSETAGLYVCQAVSLLS